MDSRDFPCKFEKCESFLESLPIHNNLKQKVFSPKNYFRNIRAMIGGHGPPNVFWWLNWLVISPILLIVTFGCIVATFGQKKAFNENSIVSDPIGYSLLVMPCIFVILYFLRDEYDRRKNMEPFVVRIYLKNYLWNNLGDDKSNW